MPKKSYRDMLLNKIPDDGTTIGNMALVNDLGWEEDKYWSVRNELVTDGIISIGRGKGGSVYKISVAKKRKKKEKYEKLYGKERSLYEPFRNVISEKYIKDKDIKNHIVQITANQGAKDTGGKWTRPDVVIVAVNTYSYLPGKIMDIISFEIKAYNDFGVSGVFETAAHSKYATKSYLCVYLPDEWDNEAPEYERIKSECERFGIGLMYFNDPNDYSTYDILVEPKRSSPDPFDMDQFISIQITDRNKKKISEFLH